MSKARPKTEPPPRMKAAALGRFGGPSVISVLELAVPEPGAGEVLVALDTAGVGVWDQAIRLKRGRVLGRIVLRVEGSSPRARSSRASSRGTR